MFQRVFRTGGVEIASAALFLLLSVTAPAASRPPLEAIAVDVVAVVAAVVATRWLRFGILLALAVAFASLALPPQDLGASLYICMLPVITAVRFDQVPLALAATALNGLASLLASARRMGDDPDWLEAVIAWGTLYGIVWAVGLGFRTSAQAEAARVAARFRQRQLDLASELHDTVARQLALLALQADIASRSGSVTPEELTAMAEQARMANQAIRAAARTLGDSGRTSPTVVTLNVALRDGVKQLERAGYAVQQVGDLPSDLPPPTDEAAGRVLQEALHNVLMHGDPSASCVIALEQTSAALDATVTNTPTETSKQQLSDGLGIPSMRRHAEAVGGHVESERLGEAWVTTITLPHSSTIASEE